METVLEINNLTKLYKNNRGVRNITFNVCKGDVIGLLGPNGSGKTTIMKTVVGLCRATEGEVKIFGMDINDNFEKCIGRMGALIEAPAIFENLTARKNLKLMSRFYTNVNDDRIEYVLKLVHLDKYRNDKTGKFSLGMKQRLGLALALLSEPELIVLDEPTNGLDIEGMVEIREIITRLAEEKGITFLIASHHAPEIEKTCNKVAVIHDGEMADFVTMEEALRLNPTLEDYFLSVVKEKRGNVII